MFNTRETTEGERCGQRSTPVGCKPVKTVKDGSSNINWRENLESGDKEKTTPECPGAQAEIWL